MIIKTIHYGIIILSLILIFSIIHLGAGIGIIANNRGFDDIFRPEIGLASFSIVLSLIGFAVGGLGLFCILTNQYSLGKIVAFLSIVLAIFAIISVIAALVINSKSAIYVSGRYSNHMNLYPSDANAKNIIDNIQSGFGCCGQASWQDWVRYLPEPSSFSTAIAATATPVVITTATAQNPTTSTTAAVATTMTTTTAASALTTTTVAPTGIPPTTISSGAVTTIAPAEGATPETTESSTVAALRMHRSVRKYVNSHSPVSSPMVSTIRRKRQTSLTSNNMVIGPYSLQFFVPTTCCINTASNSNSSSQSTCTFTSQLYTDGCLQFVVKRVNNQDMGIGIMNCFMIALALAAIPFLLHDYSASNSHGKNIPTQNIDNVRQFSSRQPNTPSVVDTYH